MGCSAVGCQTQCKGSVKHYYSTSHPLPLGVNDNAEPRGSDEWNLESSRCSVNTSTISAPDVVRSIGDEITHQMFPNLTQGEAKIPSLPALNVTDQEKNCSTATATSWRSAARGKRVPRGPRAHKMGMHFCSLTAKPRRAAVLGSGQNFH